MTRSRVRVLVVALLLAACARQEDPPGVDQPPAETVVVSEARVRELEQQARALAKADGCDRADQCAAAPMGAKPCGGPRTYLVYCKATTDEGALMRALDQLKSAEEAYNRAAGLGSDCAMVMPPEMRLEGRTCTAASP
jgi:hypothetical protein